MNQMIQIWPGNLHQNFTDAIKDIGEKQPVAQTSIGFDGGVPEVNAVRKSEIRWLNAYDHETSFIVQTLWNFAIDANRNNFGFDLNYLRDIQYTTYKADIAAKYDWHQDTFWLNPTANHRKLSIVVQLSDPSEYEGGEFQIDPEFGTLDQNVIKQRGTVMVFASFMKHRVTPVVSGVRKSLVCWVEGPKFR